MRPSSVSSNGASTLGLSAGAGRPGGSPRLDAATAAPATEETVEAVAAGVRERLGEDPTVEATDEGLRVRGVRPESIGAAVDALDDAGVAFDSLSWSEPSLEDVYLRLTGEEYTRRERADDWAGIDEEGDR